MMWQHFQAFLWLRWRLLLNQWRRGGIVNVVIQAILAVGVGVCAVFMSVGFFLLGMFGLKEASPKVLMYVWDALIVAFLFFWTIGLLLELQRSEVLVLEKFLHLPVSLQSAFLINYLSSLFSMTLFLFVPSMTAMSLGLVIAKGPAMLLVLPLLAAFVLMVTALTYQFQGWLAALMVNKRRRRTILVVVTAAFILVCQVPNLVNILQPWSNHREQELDAQQRDDEATLRRSLEEHEINLEQYQQQQTAIREQYAHRKAEVEQQTLQTVENTTWLLNSILPPGWLSLGASDAAEGNVLPALLGTLGLTLIGTISLWRSYQTTLRLYTGHYNSGTRGPVAVAAPAKIAKSPAYLLEKKLPWVSEPTAAVALGSFRSLLRVPEVKMILMTPILFAAVFGTILLSKSPTPPAMVRPLMAYGVISTVLFSMVQLVGNPFGFDRGGFRVYVLSAAPRRDILLGKNLSIAPLAFGLATGLILLMQILFPMRVDYLVAVLPQMISMYLLFCFMANWLAILAPTPIRPGTTKPMNPKGIALVLQVVFMFLFPLVLALTLLPLGLEFALDYMKWSHGVPICLVLSVVECVVVIYFYRLVLIWQGMVLQAREQKILEIVTPKAEG